MGKKEVKFFLEEKLYEAMQKILEIEGFSTVSEYLREKVRVDARRYGLLKEEVPIEVTNHA